jgi:hypothetical protein
MNGRRRILNTAGGLLLLGGLGYYIYGFASAESRLTARCAKIKPGLSIEELRVFAVEHGLRAPRGEGLNYLVETKTFGRYGCRVTVENKTVKESRYDFAD